MLTPEQVAQVAAVAVLPGTWHDHPAPHEDPVSLHQRFAELRSSVRIARRRRELWGLSIPLGGVAVLLAFGPDLLGAALSAL